VQLGAEDSWKYVAIRTRPKADDLSALPGPTRHWLREVPHPRIVRPSSVRVGDWVADGILLIGDAAHGMLPHLGLGGSLTLADVPVASEVVIEAVRNGDTAAASLRRYQDRSSRRVAYARRISEIFALATTQPGLAGIRNANLARLGRRQALLDRFIGELAGTEVPSAGVRLAVMLP
jgi:2-polyprenyl-6-methoxyphenol hydroxylase-like FAD-dependent oxidoreductase